MQGNKIKRGLLTRNKKININKFNHQNNIKNYNNSKSNYNNSTSNNNNNSK